jgi:hypothetical protein
MPQLREGYAILHSKAGHGFKNKMSNVIDNRRLGYMTVMCMQPFTSLSKLTNYYVMS